MGQMRQLALVKSLMTGTQVFYGVIDGKDSRRLIVHILRLFGRGHGRDCNPRGHVNSDQRLSCCLIRSLRAAAQVGHGGPGITIRRATSTAWAAIMQAHA